MKHPDHLSERDLVDLRDPDRSDYYACGAFDPLGVYGDEDGCERRLGHAGVHADRDGNTWVGCGCEQEMPEDFAEFGGCWHIPCPALCPPDLDDEPDVAWWPEDVDLDGDTGGRL